MIWIIIAIIVAGWLIARAIQQASAKNGIIAQEQIHNSEGYQKKQLATKLFNEMIDEVMRIRIETAEAWLNVLNDTQLSDRQKAIAIAKLSAQSSEQEEKVRAKQEQSEIEQGVLPDYDMEYKGLRSDELREIQNKYGEKKRQHDIGAYDLENKIYYKPGEPRPIFIDDIYSSTLPKQTLIKP